MRHAVVENWSRRSSPIHRRDPRVKLVCLIVVLIGAALAPRHVWAVPALLAATGLALAPFCNLPLLGVAGRSALATLFTLPFALLLAVSGKHGDAAALVVRAYSSAIFALLFIGTTSLPAVLGALRFFRTPPLLIDVIHFIYRYLLSAGEQVHRMRTAVRARGRANLRSSAGIVGVLFAKSYRRAEGIHRAMASRGYDSRYLR